MEATKTTKEALNDSAKISEKILTATIDSVMDSYNRQLQLTTELYDNFINSLFGNNKNKSDRKDFSDMFLNSDLAKWTGTTFSDFTSNTNPVISTVDGIYKQMLEYNRNFLASIQNIKAKQIDWKTVNAEYLKTIETQIEASKKIGSSLSEAYNKQMDLSIESNKKMLEEINNQLNLLMKQNQKFMIEFFKTQQPSTVVEEKKSKETSPSKETSLSENKKKWEVPIID